MLNGIPCVSDHEQEGRRATQELLEIVDSSFAFDATFQALPPTTTQIRVKLFGEIEQLLESMIRFLNELTDPNVNMSR